MRSATTFLGENAPKRSRGRLRDIDFFEFQGRARAVTTSMTFARASSTESMERYNHDASLVPRGTIVASRSGPVETIPISASSLSEMKFR